MRTKTVLKAPIGLADLRPRADRVRDAKAHLLKLLDRGDYYEAYQRLIRQKPPPEVVRPFRGSFGTAIGTLAERRDLDRAIELGVARVFAIELSPGGRRRKVSLETIRKAVNALNLPEFKARFGALSVRKQLEKLAELLCEAWAQEDGSTFGPRERAAFVDLIYSPVLRERKTPS